MKLLENKNIFITGATKGIGREMALKFAENGANLIINGKNEEELLKLKVFIEKTYNVKVIAVPYNVVDIAKTKEAFDILRRELGGLDCIVNNAGILNDRLLGMIDVQNVDEVFNVNLKATIMHLQFASRLMKRKKNGSIINISSIIGTNGNEGQVVYSASKAGVIGVTKSASKELAKYNIRVNAICPGFIDTDMARSISEEKYKERINNIKMKRIGTPEDVANVAMFLCSDLSSYVTGQVIGVDGGMII
ncbi:SDR family NAD(P)-dependent oxidoreductase [Tepidibacter sp. Z1-5]|uniref:SDR family NAD(P)-dependent oxidoreductase n=1 Tax=Tepidibacter sp. Z1-5 TaxID=3134138 RepID=UPI0030C3DD99